MTTDKREADHETIWLEPKCTEYGGNDRHWAPDNPWGESCDECEEKPVKFIRFDLHETQLATLRQSLSAAEATIAAQADLAEKRRDEIEAAEARVKALESQLEEQNAGA